MAAAALRLPVGAGGRVGGDGVRRAGGVPSAGAAAGGRRHRPAAARLGRREQGQSPAVEVTRRQPRSRAPGVVRVCYTAKMSFVVSCVVPELLAPS